MKRTLLTLTVIPSLTGGLILELLENKGRNTFSYLLSYKKSVHPFTSINDIHIEKNDLAETWEREVPANEAEEILERLKGANVSAMPTYALGLDGTMYMLSVVNGMNEARFGWWHEVPEGWEAVGEVSESLLRMAGEFAADRNV